MRVTHTFVTLEVSATAYDEIKAKLEEADYDHAFVDEAIDMHGIGLVRARSEEGTVPAPGLLAALKLAEEALGENLVWLADRLDPQIRQKDGDTLRKLDQLTTAWKVVVAAIAKAEGR